MFECEKCGGDTRVMVQIVVSAPSDMMHNFTKGNMRSKEFKIMGVLWETGDFICNLCGHVTDGYGNYVTNLRKENEKLKTILLNNGIEYVQD